MDINRFSLYSMNVNNEIINNNDTVSNYIDDMKNIKDYYEIISYAELHFGKFDDWLEKRLSKNAYLGISKEDNVVELIIANCEKQILFGRRWKFVPNDIKEDGK